MTIQLSPEQTEAFDNIMKWYEKGSKKTYALAGYAGTGKTTLSKFIQERIGSVLFLAYTGKAVNVLMNKGCYNSATLHSALYKLVNDKNGKLEFRLDENSSVKSYDLVIVDEYSMVPDDIINDLEFMANKVLYLGDPFQLPPINGDEIVKADFFLTKIHRQALDSNIIKAATMIRKGKSIPYCNLKDFIHTKQRDLDYELCLEVDQLITGYNKTRRTWNKICRDLKGFKNPFPEKNEKVICLKNNKERGLYNGMIGYTSDNSIDYSTGKVAIDFEKHKDLICWKGDFLGENRIPKQYNKKNIQRFDYAYAITCHKSQGSEFDSILVFNEPVGNDSTDRRRWLYTAITRGSKKVILAD